MYMNKVVTNYTAHSYCRILKNGLGPTGFLHCPPSTHTLPAACCLGSSQDLIPATPGHQNNGTTATGTEGNWGWEVEGVE